MKPVDRPLCLPCYVYLCGRLKLTPVGARQKEDVCAQCKRKKKTFLYRMEDRTEEGRKEDGKTTENDPL